MNRRQKQRNPRRLIPLKEDSLEDLKRKLENEREWMKVQRKSVADWTSIIEEFHTDLSQATDESEWKTRFYFHTLYNDMLQKQIKSMEMEIRAIKHGRFLFPSTMDLTRMSAADWKVHVKNLETELKTVTGLCKSYDRQLDAESTGYHKAREECDNIYNDVWFQQKARIQEQEVLDRRRKGALKGNDFQFIPDTKYNKPTVLPSISRGKSAAKKKTYSKMYAATKQKHKPEKSPDKRHVQFCMDSIDLYEYSPTEMT